MSVAPTPRTLTTLDDVEIVMPTHQSSVPSPLFISGSIRKDTGSTLRIKITQGSTTIEEYTPATSSDLGNPDRLNYSQMTSDLANGDYTVEVYLDPSTGSGSSKTRDFTVTA